MRDELSRLDRPGATDAEDELLEGLVAQVRRFAERHIDSAEIDREHVISEEVLRGAAELGLFSASIPQEYGGAGFGLQAVCSLIAQVAPIDRSVATTIGLHLGLGTRGIVRYGPDAVREEVLAKMAAGEWIASFAATEPDAGSDLTAIRTRVVADGDELILDGTKAYVTNAAFSNVLTLLVSSPGLGGARRGHSMVYIHRDDPGVSFGEEEQKLGLRGSSTRTVFLEGVRIPASRIIGRAGQGMDQAHEVLAWGRTAMAAGCVGTASEALKRAVDYAQIREQFGKALIDMPVVRDQIARMSATLFAMESLVRYTAHVAEDGPALVARSTASKVFCSEGAWEIADMALQLHGGLGFIEETGMSLLLRDSRITRIFEGANDVLRIHAGAIEATAPRQRPSILEAFPDDDLARQADRMAEQVAAHRSALRDAHGIRLLRNQRLLHQLGSAIVISEVTDAAVLRALVADTATARAQASCWLDMAASRLDAALRPLGAAEVSDAIVEGLL